MRLLSYLSVLTSLGASALWASLSETPVVAAPRVSNAAFASIGMRPSHNRLYTAEVVDKTSLKVGEGAAWTIHLTQRNHRRVAYANVIATVFAPLTDEHVFRKPTAHYLGGGNYRVEGIDLPHAGWWNVALVIDARAGVDSVAFNVILPDSK